MSKKCNIIAICGVDGSGKSSIVNTLEADHFLDDCLYVRREKYKDSNLSLINRFHERRYGDSRDWINGPYAESVGIAIALDYLRYYQEVIEKEAGHYQHIVCDRYTWCFISYLKSIGSTFPIESLFGKTLPATKILYINAGLHNLEKRYQARNQQNSSVNAINSDDENPVVMENFHQAYMACLEQSIGINIELTDVSIIDNSGNFCATMNQVHQALSAYTKEGETL